MNKLFIVLINIIAAIGVFLYGFDTAIISGTIAYIKNILIMRS